MSVAAGVEVAAEVAVGGRVAVAAGTVGVAVGAGVGVLQALRRVITISAVNSLVEDRFRNHFFSPHLKHLTRQE